ncbi:hypothetical protein [Asticcacaulis sp. EMRT-3]|uniref:hypothetical protein n=1 Tax=Asticcacaulis sp. EMRT-3 TaxID=3040349 RepID=UPI0024AFCF9B|nr:hypothetical protein [Asticcacaulis sp. EMRT-3]MDI7773872.1 hypothetical protein [Asticcacaulis sp. EMRT-3]
MRKMMFLGMILGGMAVSGAALAWGATGHRMIGEEAVRLLPSYMPAFLRTAGDDVGEYANEPDRWRGAGGVHSERDALHFINIDDDGLTAAGVTIDHLPATREAYAAAVVAKGGDPDQAGYLPYAEVDAYQQVVKDFAYWRVLSLMETREHDAVKKAWYHADRLRREAVIAYDTGLLGHYVGDATQPMHLSIHYNGWGPYPNPQGFTKAHIHVPLEAAYVAANIEASDLKAFEPDYVPCTAPVMTCFTTRMKASFAEVVPLYQLEKDGGFADGDPRGKAFIAKQLALGATNLRDALIDAWRDSKNMGVGYPAAPYDDFIAGKVDDPWVVLHGV